MRAVIKYCFVTLIIFALSTSAYAVDKKQLLLYYPCDEGSGEDIKDASGNKRDAEWRDGVAKRAKGNWTDGKWGKSLDFKGTQCGCYETKDDPELDEALGTTPFTISYYVRTKLTGGKGRTIDKGSHGCNNGWHSADTNGNCIIEAAQDGGCIAQAYGPIADGEWHYIAQVLVPGVSWKCYIDGEDNWPDNGAMKGKKSIRSQLGRPLALGVSFEFNTEFFTGQLDEISLWGYAMTKDETDQLMEAPVTNIIAVDPAGGITATWGGIKVGN